MSETNATFAAIAHATYTIPEDPETELEN